MKILKILIVPKNLKRNPLGFSNIHFVVKYQKKIEERTLWGQTLSKKISQCRKKLKGGPFVSPGIVC